MSSLLSMLKLLAPLIISFSVTLAFPVEQNSQGKSNQLGQPGNASFDYVIIGGGTAGLTVAARLAENPKLRIAVIEAGDFYETVNGNLSVVPGYGAQVSTPAVEWGFVTTPQTSLKNRTLAYNRGKTVGGSSATNLMAYHRGTTQSYDLWAKAVGDDSYTFSKFLPYFRKSVKYTAPNMSLRAANASVPNPSSQSYSASGGPLDITFPNWGNPVSSYAPAAFKEIGLDTIPDLTSGVLIGNQYSPVTIRPSDQTRSTSESSFWQASVKSGRGNLILYTKSMAKKILFTTAKKATAVVVETGGVKYTLSAKREVIVSAGVIQSPQLLMVSGVGPAATLKEFDIPVIADRRGVGQNMQDHLFFSMVQQVSVVTESSLFYPIFAATAETQYNTNATGILTNTGAEYFAWEKLSAGQRSQLSATAKADLASFPADWPEYEIVIGDLGFQPGADYAQIIGMLEAQIGRGYVTIASSDAAEPPVIDTKTFSTATDRAVAVTLFKRMRAFMATKAIAPILGPEVLPGPAVQNDTQIMEYLLNNVGPGFHGSCTCTMGKSNDPMAVVDSKAKVIGVENLRVVDASSFALLPPGHLLATVYALAEKIADDIINDY